MQMNAGGCCCGCCFPDSETGVDWARIPQRFEINSDPWSWLMPSGATQVSDRLTGDPFDQFHMTTFARSLANVGQGNVAWILPRAPSTNGSKYSASFGLIPASSLNSALSPTPNQTGYVNTNEGVWQWVAADDESLWQTWWDAGTFGSPYQFATSYSYLTEMMDSSANASGATPWRIADLTAIYAQSVSDIGSLFSDPDTTRVSTTIGTEHRIYIQTLANGQCHWVCKIKIKPRFTILTDGSSGPSTKYGRVDPAIARSFNGWSAPPYLINVGYTTNLPYDEQSRYLNRGGPNDLSTPTSKPPGGWRSWIEIAYVSDNPINCTNDVADAGVIPMSIVEVVNVGGSPSPTPTWAEYLAIMSSAFGLSTPPSTMTLQRLADIT